MKTSMDIAEPLWHEVKQLARQRGTTTKSLVEQALVRLLAEAADEGASAFRLRDVTFGTGGVTTEFAGVGWEQLRDAIYPSPVGPQRR